MNARFRCQPVVVPFACALLCGCGNGAPPQRDGRGQPQDKKIALAPAVPPPVVVALPPVQKADVELSPEEETNVRVYSLVNRSVVNITTR